MADDDGHPEKNNGEGRNTGHCLFTVTACSRSLSASGHCLCLLPVTVCSRSLSAPGHCLLPVTVYVCSQSLSAHGHCLLPVTVCWIPTPGIGSSSVSRSWGSTITFLSSTIRPSRVVTQE